MVKIYSEKEIEIVKKGGEILAKVFKGLQRRIKIGVNLRELDELAHNLTRKLGAEPAFFGYRPDGARYPYPFAICTSLNNIIVHGQPTSYKLKSGDVLKIDFGIKYKGTRREPAEWFYSDAAFTVIVGKSDSLKNNLIKATKKALEEAMEIAKPGKTLGDIGWAIEKTAKKFGVKVIKGLTGHGIGQSLHEDPTIYNYGKKGTGLVLKPGMVLAIEPMFAIGTDQIIQNSDESWATKDGSLSAHFEHTIVITDKGSRVLTE